MDIMDQEEEMGELLEYNQRYLTREEIALIQLYERMAVRKTIVPSATNSNNVSNNRKRGRTMPPKPSNIPAAPKIVPPRGPSMFDKIVGQDLKDVITNMDDPNPSLSSSISSSSSSSKPIPIPSKLPTKTIVASTGIKRKARLPTGRTPAGPSSSQSAFDRGELHLTMPSENIVWSGPQWISEFAEDELNVILPMDDAHDVCVISCDIPKDSAMFAINICPENHDSETVFFHFNPRQFERGGSLVVDFKISGEWVRHERYSLAPLPQLFGLTNAQLAFNITPAGVRVSCNGSMFLQYMFRDEVLKKLNPTANLEINVPTCNDFGTPTRITLHSIWWGSINSLKGGGGRGGMKAWKGLPWTCGNEAGKIIKSKCRAMHVSALPKYPEGSKEALELNVLLEKLLKEKECSEVQHIEVTPSRGIAAVTFARPQALVTALSKLANAKINDRRIRVDSLKTSK